MKTRATAVLRLGYADRRVRWFDGRAIQGWVHVEGGLVIRRVAYAGLLLFASLPLPAQEPTFRTGATTVLVPVVVRDGRGRPIGDLRREEFRLLDQGEAQPIASFAVERRGQRDRSGSAARPAEAAGGRETLPQRFTVYVFDDLHIALQDFERTKKALRAHWERGVPAGTRVALVSSSGMAATPLTADSQLLLAALERIKPNNATETGMRCPEISYYLADQIENRRDMGALYSVMGQLARCSSKVPDSLARQIVRNEASMVLRVEREMTVATLRALERSLGLLSQVRGQRSVVVLSTGFHLTSERPELERVEAQAVALQVRVSAMNAHGVHGEIVDADHGGPSRSYETRGLRLRSDALAGLADQTGGYYAHNTNDLLDALERAVEADEVVYVLGFTPPAELAAGTVRRLQVEVPGRQGVAVQARRDYRVPVPVHGAAASAGAALATMFSTATVEELAVSLEAGFTGDGKKQRVRVIVRVDAAGLPLRNAEGQNLNSLTLVYRLFDKDGRAVAEATRAAELRLNEAALESFRQRGIQMGMEFDALDEKYLARVVVVEAESGRSAAVEQLVVRK